MKALTSKVIRLRSLPVTLLILFMLSQPGYTHHSAAMFDLETTRTVEGTVAKFQWTNPHVWIHIDTVDEAGNTVTWRVEHVSPNVLKRQGWKRTSFRKGDKVSVTFYPAKSGDRKGGFIRATTADGSHLGAKGDEPHPELREGYGEED